MADKKTPVIEKAAKAPSATVKAEEAEARARIAKAEAEEADAKALKAEAEARVRVAKVAVKGKYMIKGDLCDTRAEADEMVKAAGVADFWLSSSRFLRQAGQRDPEYVQASPEATMRVRLEVKCVRKHSKTGEIYVVDQPLSGFLRKAKPTEPEDVRPGVKAHKPPAAGAVPVANRGRAADQ